MSIIKFNSQEFDRFTAFLDALPDIGQLDAEELKQCRMETEQVIRELDALEPRSQASEAYEQWADLHEELEDALDEILDCLEDLGES